MTEHHWRIEAVRRFPEFAEKAKRAETAYQFWNDLLLEFVSAYDSDQIALVSRIYEYAWWCCDQPRRENAEDDLLTCVTVSFFEHIPEHPKALQDMPRWWRLEDVRRMKEVFSHIVGEQGYARVLEQYNAQRPP